MSTFTWLLDYEAEDARAFPGVDIVKFGDGYEMRQARGLNTNPQSWSASFTKRSEDEANEISDFLDATGGVDSFDWTPPGGVSAKFKMSGGYKKRISTGNLWSITTSFVQVFEP